MIPKEKRRASGRMLGAISASVAFMSPVPGRALHVVDRTQPLSWKDGPDARAGEQVNALFVDAKNGPSRTAQSVR